jgi:hypothetical protein
MRSHPEEARRTLDNLERTPSAFSLPLKSLFIITTIGVKVEI